MDLKQSMDSLFNEKTKYQFDTQYGYSININNADSSNRIIGFEGIGLNTTSVPSIQGSKNLILFGGSIQSTIYI
ncbi:MAG: hypothetical protein IPO64_14475 [Bacteroidetes bacterium]|nr:hypothetical protein [Bacteroidota bacterium]